MAVQSVERAFALLRSLSVGPLGVTELAERAGLPKSTVARLLAALEAEEAVEQIEGGSRYRLAHGLIDIAGAAAPGRNLVATARPVLLELTDTVGETAGLSVEADSGRDVYYLDHTEIEADVQVRSWTGESLPIHSVPSGLVLMAHWDTSTLEALLATPLPAATNHTLTDPASIRERLVTIRSLGYSWGYEEGVEGINSVAAPILGSAGSVVAAVHIHGPAYRFPNPDRSHDIGLLTISAASAIAGHLAG